MRQLQYLAFTVALLGTAVSAAAQTSQPSPGDQQRTFPQTGASPGSALPGPNATPPGAEQHSPSADTVVQPVPGAMPGSDTIPSTMSEKTAADDKLVTFAYTFKDLTSEQHSAIFDGVKGSSSPQQVKADLGTELPASIQLHPVPDAVLSKVPHAKGYAYVLTDNKVLLVQPPTRIVVGVIDAPAASTSGAAGGNNPH